MKRYENKRYKKKRYKNKRYENKRYGIIISVITVLACLILVGFISNTIHSVDGQVTESSYQNLKREAANVGRELRKSVDSDRAALEALEHVIVNRDEPTEAELSEILQYYDVSASYLSEVEMLRPDNTILDSSGKVWDATGSLDFATEVERGAYVSDVVDGITNPNEKVMRNAVPVVLDGENIAMLYGVIRLSDLARRFDVDIYNDDAYLLVEDGDSGDFIIDNWHEELGNITDFTNRKLLQGNSWDAIITDLQEGKSGQFSLVSTRIDEPVYMYYEPSGINNLNILVMTSQTTALSDGKTVRMQLYTMAAVIGLVVMVYMFVTIGILLRMNRDLKSLSIEDQSTGLLNRNAYELYAANCREKVFATITCIYVDVNGLHSINNQFGHKAGDRLLCTVADVLKYNFKGCSIYRIGGDEFVILCENDSIEVCRTSMEAAVKQIEEHDYSISYGMVSSKDETGVENIMKLADEQMLHNKAKYYEHHARRR